MRHYKELLLHNSDDLQLFRELRISDDNVKNPLKFPSINKIIR